MTIEIVVPELGESVLEATVARWFKQEGERVEIGEPVVELETDKVNLEVGAEKTGVLASISKAEDEDVEVGDVLGMIEEVEEEKETEPEVEGEEEPGTEEEQESAEERDREPTEEKEEGDERITPVAKRLAEDKGIDISELLGSGLGGRITKEDVQKYIRDRQKGDEPTKEKPQEEKEETEMKPKREEFPQDRREERVRMSRRRRTIASRLVEVQHTAAMLTTFNEVDMSAVMDLRKRRNPVYLEEYGFKLGITSFFIKASIGALKKFPRLNAEIQGEEMVLKHYYDIGVAIGAEEGLVVPVLRDADRMSFAEIEQQIKDFVDKTEKKTLTLEDLRGGTFTITNGGVFGSLLSTPILNPPQVSILGLHKIESRPVVVDGEMAIRPMMYVAVSYDHRIVDGREAVQFLVRIKELVEDPERLLLEG